jgi:regulator of replication initiation timing
MRRLHRQRRSVFRACLCMKLSVNNIGRLLNAKSELTQFKLLLGAMNSYVRGAGHVGREFLGDGLYLALILLLSADVELNPGPLDDKDIQYLDKHFTETKTSINALNTKVDDLAENITSKVTELTQANEQLSNKVAELETRLDMQEKKQRKRNIVLFGAPADAQVYEYLEGLFKEKLQINSPLFDSVENAFRIGRAEGKPPILIQFVSERRKMEVMRQAHLLKGTRITLSDDLTPNERIQRRVIVAAQREAKKLGIQAKVRQQGLLVNNEFVRVEALSRPGWAQKHTGKHQGNSTSDGIERDGDSEIDSPEEPQNKKQKNAPNEDIRSVPGSSSAAGFCLAPAVIHQQKDKQSKKRGAQSRSSERRNPSRGSQSNQHQSLALQAKK